MKKSKHVRCAYTIKEDGSMSTLNAQVADKCIYKLANNQNFYEYQVDTYRRYIKEETKGEHK